jgi:hypothetical protein
VRYIEPKSFSDPEKAARKLIEIANAAESVQDQRVHIELINVPFLRAGGSGDGYAKILCLRCGRCACSCLEQRCCHLNFSLALTWASPCVVLIAACLHDDRSNSRSGQGRFRPCACSPALRIARVQQPKRCRNGLACLSWRPCGLSAQPKSADSRFQESISDH